MKTHVRFAELVVAIIGALVWLAMGGISECKTYFQKLSELSRMGDKAHTEPLRAAHTSSLKK